MDSVPEKGPQQSPEIPENWKFEERKDIGQKFRVLQIAKEQRFLALEYLKSGTNSIHELQFDSSGKEKGGRHSPYAEAAAVS